MSARASMARLAEPCGPRPGHGLLLFALAGTVRYWHAWIYLVRFVGLSAIITADLIRHDPALLERRLASSGLLVVPALDFRFQWSHVPLLGVVLGDALFVLGCGFIGSVYWENTFALATIQVVEGQRLVATGPYAVVRHPMYASPLVYLIGTPLALGSYWGLVALALMLPVLVWRLIDEECLLTQELDGYADYKRRVRYRLLPFIW